MEVMVCGDILVEVMQSPDDEEIFRFNLHTSFVLNRKVCTTGIVDFALL
jgi:hypothetical protein